jgi:L-amino acid N-acyltransferase YncA
MSVVIQYATQDDAKHIANIHVSAWQAAYDGLMPDTLLNNLNVLDCEQAWQERLLQGCKVLIANALDQTLGFLSYCPSRDTDANPEKTAEISAIYLAPTQWHKGIGTALYQAMRNEVLKLGFTDITLWVLETNEPAKLFYERLGFTTSGDTKIEIIETIELKEIRYKKTFTKL